MSRMVSSSVNSSISFDPELVTTSTGNTIFSVFIRVLHSLIKSSSTKVLPVWYPSLFKNVAHIAPPTRTLSVVGSKFLIIAILSDTLAPPSKSVLVSFLILSNSAISFSTRKPTAWGKYLGIPVVDAWARWEEAKASRIYTSPKLDQYRDSASSQLLSNLFG